ncbi:hypothetical protein Vau01_124040 [Virgisporangium aurantiacum]|uniref:Uncharacterized protein n=1 Tax=Virgisporangium aurantiacum TaxID=175570 RepID=A0A8J4E853_9ACTN|nr:hypothetical protein Vau01_124040 [Virgisporangium aurantiacum]
MDAPRVYKGEAVDLLFVFGVRTDVTDVDANRLNDGTPGLVAVMAPNESAPREASMAISF